MSRSGKNATGRNKEDCGNRGEGYIERKDIDAGK